MVEVLQPVRLFLSFGSAMISLTANNETQRWEIPRFDVAVDVRFYGHSERLDNGRAIWTAGQEVLAVAYDVPVPGCKCLYPVLCLRCTPTVWKFKDYIAHY